MSVALYLFCFDVPFTILFVAVLSVATGFGSCWWNISSRAVLMDVAFWQFSNNHPNYDFVDDAMTFLIMLHSTCTGPFSGAYLESVFWSLVLGKNIPGSALCLRF